MGTLERVRTAGFAVTFAAVPQARRRIKFFAKLSFKKAEKAEKAENALSGFEPDRAFL